MKKPLVTAVITALILSGCAEPSYFNATIYCPMKSFTVDSVQYFYYDRAKLTVYSKDGDGVGTNTFPTTCVVTRREQ